MPDKALATGKRDDKVNSLIGSSKQVSKPHHVVKYSVQISRINHINRDSILIKGICKSLQLRSTRYEHNIWLKRNDHLHVRVKGVADFLNGFRLFRIIAICRVANKPRRLH